MHTVNQDSRENLIIRLSDISRLEKHPATPVRAATDIVNQDSEENYMIGLLTSLILGEQSALPIGANIIGEAP